MSRCALEVKSLTIEDGEAASVVVDLLSESDSQVVDLVEILLRLSGITALDCWDDQSRSGSDKEEEILHGEHFGDCWWLEDGGCWNVGVVRRLIALVRTE